MTDTEHEESPMVYVNWACHMCPEKFNNVFEMRDHWQRDHAYNVRIVVR